MGGEFYACGEDSCMRDFEWEIGRKKKSLGKPTSRWKDNIKTDLK